jgi:hypothetical protein
MATPNTIRNRLEIQGFWSLLHPSPIDRALIRPSPAAQVSSRRS